MAYTIKNPQDFTEYLNNYLEKHPLDLDYKEKHSLELTHAENIINNFSSSNLSDLYKLFLDLKDEEINNNSYCKLKEIISNNFSINSSDIFELSDENSFPFIFSKNHIHKLENIIKDRYLAYVSSNNFENIDKEELYNLSVIVNKIFPEIFLDLIKTPSQDDNNDKSISFVKDKILSTINHWHLHNAGEMQNATNGETETESEAENRDIISAIYITAKKLYPEFHMYTVGRIKSMKSSINNINKETTKSLLSLLPSNLSTGLSYDDVKDQFNLDGANTDFSGFTIVLNDVDDTLHFDPSDSKYSNVLELRKTREDNIKFLHSIENFLFKNDPDALSNADILQIQIDLLIRLRESTYEECTREFKNTSFKELLRETIKKYYDELKKPNKKQIFDNEILHVLETDNIYEFIDELKDRVDDKYQAKLLEIAVPDMLEDVIFSKNLKVESHFVKTVTKENGYHSLHFHLITEEGRIIELQVQTRKRFKDSKDGPSDHSTLSGKEVDILHFFEPVDENCDPKIFNTLLNTLNTTPIATKNRLYDTKDHNLSPRDRSLKRKLRVAEQNIKIKESFVFKYKENIRTFTLEEYLPIFAEYHSPKLISVSSPHTRFNTSIAAYNKKSLVSGFREVLLKHDSTTCLSQQLIDKLESIVPSDKNEVSKNGIVKRAAERSKKRTATNNPQSENSTLDSQVKEDYR